MIIDPSRFTLLKSTNTFIKIRDNNNIQHSVFNEIDTVKPNDAEPRYWSGYERTVLPAPNRQTEKRHFCFFLHLMFFITL